MRQSMILRLAVALAAAWLGLGAFDAVQAWVASSVGGGGSAEAAGAAVQQNPRHASHARRQ